jgi:gluconolactonase
MAGLRSYDGHPNGLKIHRDGRIFVADHHLGLLCFDPLTHTRSLVADRADESRFRGLNDLVFGDDGDLFFTDPGESALENPNGRVFRRRAAGTIDLLMDGLPDPNGLVLSPSQKTLYVAVTRSQQVPRLPLHPQGTFKCGMFLQLSGGLAGPDGMAIGADGSLVVVHAGFGTVWVFDSLGEPVARIRRWRAHDQRRLRRARQQESLHYRGRAWSHPACPPGLRRSADVFTPVNKPS